MCLQLFSRLRIFWFVSLLVEIDLEIRSSDRMLSARCAVLCIAVAAEAAARTLVDNRQIRSTVIYLKLW